MTRISMAIAAAAVVGTLANALAAGLVLGPDKFALALVPGRYVVAAICAAALPVLSSVHSRRLVSHLLSIAFLVIAPSLIAKFMFGAGAPWSTVLALNAVYALAAWVTYVLISRYASTKSNT